MTGKKVAPWMTVLGIVVACALAFALGTALRHVCHWQPAVAWAEIEGETEPADESSPPLQAVAERQMVEEEERGQVRLGDRAVLEIQTAAGGLTGYERAMIVAKRLNDALAAGLGPSDVRSTQVSGMSVVQAGSILLITVTRREAERHNITVVGLAEAWATAIAAALPGEQVPPPLVEPEPEPTAIEPTPAEEEVTEPTGWQPPEPYRDKTVPIISVLEGVKIGLARVSGPESAVDQVQAVAQLETDYKDALSISVYVPISTQVPGSTLARVQGVGVTALGDIRL